MIKLHIKNNQLIFFNASSSFPRVLPEESLRGLSLNAQKRTPIDLIIHVLIRKIKMFKLK